jgi:hypothetical protein
VLVGVLFVPLAASAQDEAPIVHGAYYYCDQSREATADMIVENVLAEIFDRHVEAGNLTAWGWLGHHSGGKWRRVQYMVAANQDALLDTRDQIIEELLGEYSSATQGLIAACPSHDDYIWTFQAGSQPGDDLAQERPSAGYSTYFTCDISREARADTLVMEAIGPILDRHVGEGELNSWGWFSHTSGGKYRRLAVYDGADHKSVLNAVQAAIADVGAEQQAASTEFSEICNSHTDYMWNILVARP